jgi:N utilization substance protein A
MEALDVDEMVGQVLASEGFSQVEEVAYVDLGEITAIEGFDEETANELQTRAREYLDKVESNWTPSARNSASRTNFGRSPASPRR